MTNLWYSNHRKLSSGDRGQDVKYLQINLENVIFPAPTLKPYGNFGPKTKAAVIKFQKESGLLDDGIAGPLTYAKVSGGRFRFAPVTPPVVAQGSAWICWAACLESVLGKSWVGRKKMSTNELLEKFKDSTGGKGAIDPRAFKAAGTVFRYNDITDYFRKDPRLYAERIVKLLNARRPLILVTLNPGGGVGHAIVVYGVLVKQKSIFVMVMDPMVGYKDIPLLNLQPKKTNHFIFFAPIEVPI